MIPSFRCSELDRVLTCHISRLFAMKIGDRFDKKDDGARTEGNWCHHEAARILVDEESASVGDGGIEPPALGEWKPNHFSQWVVDYFLSVVRNETAGMALIVEDELEADFREFKLTGHADVLAFSADGKEAIGFDLKAGAIPVDEAQENNQMLGYIVLTYLCYPGVESVRWLIVQPKNNPDDSFERVTEVIISGKSELEQMASYLDKSLTRVLMNPLFINSDDNGGRQCKYCPAAIKCPAIRKDINEMKTVLTTEAINDIEGDISIGELIFFEDARKKFDGPLKMANDELKRRLREHGMPFELEDGRVAEVTSRNGRRTWKPHCKPQALAKVDSEGLPPELRCEVLDVKIGELEKAIAKHRGLPITSKKSECAKDAVAGEYGDLYDQSTVEMVVIR